MANYFKIYLALFLSVLVLATQGHAKVDLEEAQIKVAMRTIGHQFLLQSGDSVSRVLAVEQVNGRYKIEFSEEFQFDPSDLVTTIDGVVQKTGIASNYLVEVEACESSNTIYSYQIGGIGTSDLIPCGGRMLPQNCYKIFFTILDVKAADITETSNSSNLFSIASLSLLLGSLGLVSLFIYGRRKKPQINPNPHTILIGDYSYDKKSMLLSYKDTQTELSSKEADLLILLYDAENKVLERENILKVVWGDKGDYVGRTLDVFISKLRKKLAADPNLKIVNIRGIGYKFVLVNKK